MRKTSMLTAVILAAAISGAPQLAAAMSGGSPSSMGGYSGGSQGIDTRVERALAERAIGFYETWEEDKINPVTGQRETFIHREYYPPDTKAANQWLTNRKRAMNGR